MTKLKKHEEKSKIYIYINETTKKFTARPCNSEADPELNNV